VRCGGSRRAPIPLRATRKCIPPRPDLPSVPPGLLTAPPPFPSDSDTALLLDAVLAAGAGAPGADLDGLAVLPLSSLSALERALSTWGATEVGCPDVAPRIRVGSPGASASDPPPGPNELFGFELLLSPGGDEASSSPVAWTPADGGAAVSSAVPGSLVVFPAAAPPRVAGGAPGAVALRGRLLEPEVQGDGGLEGAEAALVASLQEALASAPPCAAMGGTVVRGGLVLRIEANAEGAVTGLAILGNAIAVGESSEAADEARTDFVFRAASAALEARLPPSAGGGGVTLAVVAGGGRGVAGGDRWNVLS